MNIFKKILSAFLGLSMLCAVGLGSAGCMTVSAADLMEGIESEKAIGMKTDEAFIRSSADFAVKLFQKSCEENKNSLVSPLSVMLALAMTANGADGETKAQMEKLLGGEITLEMLNRYLYQYTAELPSEEKSKLEIANSIWLRDTQSLRVEKEFLKTNGSYYNAGAYKVPFDSSALDDINAWVKKNTDGLIDKIIDEIDPFDMLFLINTIVFEAEWENQYERTSVHNGVFTSADGEEQNVKMMYSSEYGYLDDGKATGFIKDYKGGKYSFAALLPNDGVDINDYVASLDGESLADMFRNPKYAVINAAMPKFSYDYSLNMNEALKSLGMTDAFNRDTADFSKLGECDDGNLYIGKVLHKTHIEVNESGTKAAAATVVEMKCGSALAEPYEITLDRPFVYAIIDNATGLPIFLGTVMSVK